MRPASRRALAALGISLATLLSARAAAAQDKSTAPAAQSCALDYQRADNMWAAFGVPAGGLGVESVTIPSGQKKPYFTDWKFEKTRNDGTNFYGSHLRVATNRGQRPVTIDVHSLEASYQGFMKFTIGVNEYRYTLDPGATLKFRADLMAVSCPA